MDKVVFNQLIIEVTRRCNMSCAHCLRGDAQNVDILGIDIDNVLDQTEAIGNLAITGGEPTLNLKALQHIANGIAKRGIPVSRVEIVTNGLIYDTMVAICARESESSSWSKPSPYPCSLAERDVSITALLQIREGAGCGSGSTGFVGRTGRYTGGS